MEWACAGDMDYHINKGLGEPRSIFYAACVVLALEYLHSYDILYRDLKPGNIVIDAKGYAKLIDFGLCKREIGLGDKTTSFCGTQSYMAPEMLHPSRRHGRPVDWWGLGILIYVMVAGEVRWF